MTAAHPTGLTHLEYQALLDAACSGTGPLIIRSARNTPTHGRPRFKPVLEAHPANRWAFTHLNGLRCQHPDSAPTADNQ